MSNSRKRDASPLVIGPWTFFGIWDLDIGIFHLQFPMPEPVLHSVLDLSSILTGSTAAVSFKNTLALARHTEDLGYHRYWVAEHHNMPGIASSATSVLISYIANGTNKIRVGAGGIMLPNHAPLVIAEQFGTLESMFPGRIDLGLGRAPGGDPQTAAALRRNLGSSGDTFPRDLLELQSYFQTRGANQVRAVPGTGLNVPIHLLGSSDFSAALAAELGLPFAFALCAGLSASGAEPLPQELQTVEVAGKTKNDRWAQRRRRRNR
jgi:luciferase family oxidoreductase group 1